MRVRPADVADLQKLFVRGIAKSRGLGSLTLTPEAVLQLESYSFPGNIKVCMSHSPLLSVYVLSFLISRGLTHLMTAVVMFAGMDEVKPVFCCLREADFDITRMLG